MASVDAPDRAGLTVALVGAECSGKTTLAAGLARELGVPWVAEYAREFLAGRQSYTRSDVMMIARGQRAAEQALVRAGHRLVIADTDLVVAKIWLQVRFGGGDAWIDETLREELASPQRRVYLVPVPDLAWVADPLRENPHDRDALHARYLALLEELSVPFCELKGPRAQRHRTALAAIRAWLARPG